MASNPIRPVEPESKMPRQNAWFAHLGRSVGS